MPSPTVTMVSPEGVATDIPADQVDAYKARKFTLDTPETRAARVNEDTQNAQITPVESASQSIARGATFGLSDVLQRAAGGEDARLYLEHAKRAHSTVSTAGEIGGALITGGATAGRLGAAAKEVVGGGVTGAIAGGAAEGATYGAGQGVSQLALSDHPLTAEHIASTLSSNALLGGAVGGLAGGAFALGEKALTKASTAMTEAATSKAAIDGIAPELASLDEKGLRAAAQTAKAEHAADIAAERGSLEQLRVEQRAELANRVRDFHTELATERPIFQAVAGEDVRALPGVGTEIASPLNKSYRALRSAFDNPVAIAENPTRLLQPLQMQQTALENLQSRVAEIRAVVGNDARAAALEHVDYALEQNKAFQAEIRALDKSNPVAGARLSTLEAGPSAKMQAIEDARAALKNAPELGLVAKAATQGAFAGGTALAHMIPGVGIAAPFLGKGASDLVRKAFEKLSGSGAAAVEKTAATTKLFLDATSKVAKAAPVTATKVLSSVRFAATKAPETSDLGELFKQRSAEIRQQTMYAADGTTQMRPEARVALADKLKPIAAVNPLLADKIETVKARATAYIASKIPKRPDVGGIQVGPDNWKPSDLEIRAWARTIRAVEDPASVEESLVRGHITPEAADAYRTVYPERFAALQQTILEAVPTLSKTLPMSRKVALSIFTGVPCTPAMAPNVLAVLQGNFANEPGSAGGQQAPQPQPNFGALGSLKSPDKPTKSQQREGLES